MNRIPYQPGVTPTRSVSGRLGVPSSTAGFALRWQSDWEVCATREIKVMHFNPSSLARALGAARAAYLWLPAGTLFWRVRKV